MDFNKKNYEAYDVLPYFRQEWKERPHIWDKDSKRVKVKTKDELREWVESRAQYQFWSRCQYEFLMADWPFGSRRMNEDIKAFLKTNPDIDNHDDKLRLCNIIIEDMVKIDVYEQLMMNIDILVDILYDEFLMKNKK